MIARHHPATFVHDDRCPICRRGRRHRRAAVVRETGRYVAIIAAVVLVAGVNWIAGHL